ncbi:polysaccharide export outer membrane protein [Catalinimonas alkaloidigena]|uniref:Polysaccharide export outer membrane protein n=1 Tax=Catalinimonas alkaloidigena TaxID=1075417 RepID=A0A1G9E2L1_9BACT|nr:polysaccharide biosynthesis/export family protein [Catalinimonas alkaloidigena]SDK70310.1 polysaccharide export outer membrane protein [Catalinimonas alkaloidigena]
MPPFPYLILMRIISELVTSQGYLVSIQNFIMNYAWVAKGNLSRALVCWGLLLLVCTSCSYYKQDILFRTDGTANAASLQMSLADAERNYKIRVNDFLILALYTNDGEVILDPTGELTREMGLRQNNVVGGGGGNQGQNNRSNMLLRQYLVRYDGTTKLPLVGDVKLAGLTHYQADSVLAERFSEFYEDPFVICRVNNRRVFILGGSSGRGGGQVVDLENENTNLIEILARSGGVGSFANAGNIRLIRGDLKNPTVQIINLQTIEGLRQAELQVLPNDIIYIEPGRRNVFEGLRDVSPFIGLTSSLITLYFLIDRLF